MKILIRKNMKKGFSLYECLFACTLVVLFSIYVIPSLNFASRSLIDEQVELLYQIFLHLQLRAAAMKKSYTLIFDCINNTYSYKLENKPIKIIALPTSLHFGAHEKVLGPPSLPQHPIQEPSTFSKKESGIYELTFFPSMTMTPGTLYLSCKKYNQTRALTVAIDSVAFVRKYNFEEKKWRRYE